MTDNIAENLPNRVGCHCWGTSEQSVASLPVFAKAGCRWVRATRPMQMDVVACGPGKYNFADNGERSIDLAIEQGMSIMGILDGRWGNETLFNDLPYASPIWEHLDLWEDFVGATVNYYRDRVKYWEIINEPPFFWWYPTAEGEHIPEINPHIHRAPISCYVELLKASAHTIRSIDPKAKIVLGSGFYDGQFLSKVYELGGRDYFDIVSVHYLPCKHPTNFANAFMSLRNVMAKYGDCDKQLWDTENGPFGAVIGQAVQTPEAYEALYNVYRHCFAYEFGLDRYFWFNPVLVEASVDRVNLLRTDDGKYSAPYQSLATMMNLLGDGELLNVKHVYNEVHAYVFAGRNGLVTIIWSTAPAVMHLRQEFNAVDHLGAAKTLKGEIKLTGRPLFIQGDLSELLDVTVEGARETVVAPMRQATDDTSTVTIPYCSRPLANDAASWREIPFVATHENIPVTDIGQHLALVSSSVSADLQLAWDEAALYLRVRTYDDKVDINCPTGVVQFTLRDQNPEVSEWS